MKITDWAVIFVIIIAPVVWLGGLRAENLREVNRLETRYTSALRTAVQDAAASLNRNELQHFESGYGSSKWMRADKEQALAALFEFRRCRRSDGSANPLRLYPRDRCHGLRRIFPVYSRLGFEQ